MRATVWRGRMVSGWYCVWTDGAGRGDVVRFGTHAEALAYAIEVTGA